MLEVRPLYNLILRNRDREHLAGRVVEIDDRGWEKLVFSNSSPSPDPPRVDSRTLWHIVRHPEILELHFLRPSGILSILPSWFWQRSTLSRRQFWTVPLAEFLHEHAESYSAPPARESKILDSPVPRAGPLCKAGGPNYSKPHVPVAGFYDGLPAISCRFCGTLLNLVSGEKQ